MLLYERIGKADDAYVERPAVHTIDNSKLRRLGWEPHVTAADGIKRTVQSKKRHEIF